MNQPFTLGGMRLKINDAAQSRAKMYLRYVIMEWFITLIAGAVGGNTTGSMMKTLSLGAIGNTIVGLLGGAAGMQLAGMLGFGGAVGSFDIASLISQVVAGGVGGGVLVAIAGVAKKMIGR